MPNSSKSWLPNTVPNQPPSLGRLFFNCAMTAPASAAAWTASESIPPFSSISFEKLAIPLPNAPSWPPNDSKSEDPNPRNRVTPSIKLAAVKHRIALANDSTPAIFAESRLFVIARNGSKFTANCDNDSPKAGINSNISPARPATKPPKNEPIPSPIDPRIGIACSTKFWRSGIHSIKAPIPAINKPIEDTRAINPATPYNTAVPPIPATSNITHAADKARMSSDKDVAIPSAASGCNSWSCDKI